MEDTAIITDPLNFFGFGIWENLKEQNQIYNLLKKIEWSSEGSWKTEEKVIPSRPNIRKRKMILD